MRGSFNKLGEFLLKVLTKEGTVYSCTFFKEIDNDESFYVPENS